MIKIEKGMLRDLGELASIEVKAQEFPLDMLGVKDYIESPNKMVFIAKIGDRIVGHLLLGFSNEDSCAIVARLSVHPLFRNLKIGNKLLAIGSKTAFVKKLGSLRISVPSYKMEDREDPYYLKDWLAKERFKAVAVVDREYARYGTRYDAYVFERPA